MRNDPAYRRMNSTGRFALRTRAVVHSILDDHVILYDPFSDNAPEKVPANTVVLVPFNSADAEIGPELAQAGRTVITIGDARSPRYIESAIREGYAAGLAV